MQSGIDDAAPATEDAGGTRSGGVVVTGSLPDGVRRACAAASLLAVAACATTGSAPTYVKIDCLGGPGVKIVGAKHEIDGVGAEYAWIRANLPGWEKESQELWTTPDGRSYDIINLVKGNEKKKACFEITDFFGKMPF